MKQRKPQKPGKATTKIIFKKPSNPADWKPTPFQMDLYQEVIEGTPFWEVAKRLKASTQTIRDLCLQIDEYLLERSIRDIRLIRVRHQAHLESMYSKAMQSFEISKNPEVTKENGKGANGDFSKERTVTHAAGDPTFLSNARQCLADIREIWGVNKKQTDDPILKTEGEEMRVGGVPKAQLLRLQIQTLAVQLAIIEGEPAQKLAE